MMQLDEFLIDEDMRAVIEHDRQYLEERNFEQLTDEEQLKINNELSLYWSADKPSVDCIQSEILIVANRSIELRTYFPKDDVRTKYIVWVHGGGWKEGSLDGYDRLMRILANAARCAVVGIGYTKAPAAQFPAQINELRSGFEYIAETMLPDRPVRVVAGYSAGANLILSTLVAYQDELGRGYFRRACLACGVYDCDFSTRSYNRYDDAWFGNSKARMRQVLEIYAPGAISRHDPVVFPLRSNQSVCNDFLIIYAEHDLLRDDSVNLVESLRSQGKSVTARQIAGVTHIFLQRSMRIPIAFRTIVDIGEYLSAE